MQFVFRTISAFTALLLTFNSLLRSFWVLLFFTSCGIAHAQQNPIVDHGDLSLVFLPGSNDSERFIEATIREHGGIEDLLIDFNENVKLTEHIDVVFAPWSEIEQRAIDLEPNAAYDSSTKEILISYGLFISITERFQRFDYIESSRESYPREFDQKIYPTLVHVFYHELAHALIDVNGIFPKSTTCEEKYEEEFLADELSVLIIDDDELDFMPILDNFLFKQQENEIGQDGSQTVFRDCESHPTNETRDQNLMCWLYGKSPEKYINELDNPENWEDCEAEYDALESDWEARLEPILK